MVIENEMRAHYYNDLIDLFEFSNFATDVNLVGGRALLSIVSDYT